MCGDDPEDVVGLALAAAAGGEDTRFLRSLPAVIPRPLPLPLSAAAGLRSPRDISCMFPRTLLLTLALDDGTNMERPLPVRLLVGAA